MSDFISSNPSDILGMLPTTVEINDLKDGSRKPIEAIVYDEIAVYYRGRHKTRAKALDAVEKAVLKVAKAKGV